jgi:hypothetical protein
VVGPLLRQALRRTADLVGPQGGVATHQARLERAEPG